MVSPPFVPQEKRRWNGPLKCTSDFPIPLSTHPALVDEDVGQRALLAGVVEREDVEDRQEALRQLAVDAVWKVWEIVNVLTVWGKCGDVIGAWER